MGKGLSFKHDGTTDFLRWDGCISANQINTIRMADQYDSIQDAIDSLPSSGGKVFIPSGTYTITSPLTINTHSTVIEGAGLSTLIQFNFNDAAIKNANTTTHHRCHIKNLRINSITAGQGTGINLDYLSLSKVENVFIYLTNIGIDTGANQFYKEIVNPHVTVQESGSIGIKIQSNQTNVYGGRITGDSNSIGIECSKSNAKLFGTDIESGLDIGVDVTATGHNTLLSGIYIEANATNLRLASGVEAFTCVGGILIDATTANITDSGADTPVFLNTRVQYNPYSKLTNVSNTFTTVDGKTVTVVNGIITSIA